MCWERSVILDSADCWAASLAAEGVADMFVSIDFEDQDDLFTDESLTRDGDMGGTGRSSWTARTAGRPAWLQRVWRTCSSPSTLKIRMGCHT